MRRCTCHTVARQAREQPGQVLLPVEALLLTVQCDGEALAKEQQKDEVVHCNTACTALTGTIWNYLLLLENIVYVPNQ